MSGAREQDLCRIEADGTKPGGVQRARERIERIVANPQDRSLHGCTSCECGDKAGRSPDVRLAPGIDFMERRAHQPAAERSIERVRTERDRRSIQRRREDWQAWHGRGSAQMAAPR